MPIIAALNVALQLPVAITATILIKQLLQLFDILPP